MSEMNGFSFELTRRAFPRGGRIACQGVAGAYSQMAAEKCFPEGELSFVSTFAEVFRAVREGGADFGVVPAENNTYGTVRGVQEELKEGGVTIARCTQIRIEHRLLVKKGTRPEEIDRIFSHEQAIGQCSVYLNGLPEHVQVIPCLNTAIAAQEVAGMNGAHAAAIASLRASELYGLEPLDIAVMNTKHNYTRFYVLQKEPYVYPGANRISLLFTVEHRPGALYDALEKFKALGINMYKLESLPIPGRNFKFMFYVDIEASMADPVVVRILERMCAECGTLLYLGNYEEV